MIVLTTIVYHHKFVTMNLTVFTVHVLRVSAWHDLSCVMRRPVFWVTNIIDINPIQQPWNYSFQTFHFRIKGWLSLYIEIKSADQLYSNCAAYRHHCFVKDKNRFSHDMT